MLTLRPTKSDHGATAIVIALCLVLLMGMAAVAIDLGAAFNERRQDQSAADVGSLAAVQFATLATGSGSCSGFTGQTLARCNGAQQAIEVANATLDNPSAAQWATAAECPGIPTGYTASPLSNCVAFNSNLQRAWVRVPTIELGTTFGRVIGSQAINTTAAAIALTFNANRQLLLPFLTPSAYGAGNYACLKTGPNPDWGACAPLPATGNFGNADFYLYQNEQLGTLEECGGNAQHRLISNIARGVDHPLSIHPTGTGSGLTDQSGCPVFSAQPNMLQSQTGLGSSLDDGLTRGASYYSASAYDGRIEDNSGSMVRNAGGSNPATLIDSTPLWNLLIPGLAAPCDKAQVDTPAEMLACIGSAKSTSTVIFLDSIVDAKRFGFTPLMWESGFGGPPTFYHLQDFLPVYLDTTYYNCTGGPSGSCTIAHTPGGATFVSCPTMPVQITCGAPGAWNRTLQAVTAYTLNKAILPPAAQTPYPGANNQRTYSLVQ